MSVDDLLMRAGLDIGAKVDVRRELRSMAREGLISVEGKRFAALPEEPPVAQATPVLKLPAAPGTGAGPKSSAPQRRGPEAVVGTIRRHRDGYGFIAALTGGDDLFVPPQVIGDALDGDLVRALPGPGRDGRPVARTLEVVERRRQYAVGTYREARGRSGAWVESRDESLVPIRVSPTKVAADGDVVRVRLDRFEGGEIFGTVASRLGLPGDPDVEVLSVAYGEGFADLFPPDVVQASERVPQVVRAEDKSGRRDLTGLELVTIDGEDARDFDDAIYVERLGEGFRLVVAIADVTAYVDANGALDLEARRRATSVYFPQHVLPMLPERLSNGICSLNPAVERLCMVADMRIDAEGNPTGAEFYPAVMLSKARCTYTAVAKLLAGEALPEFAHVTPMLQLAGGLAKRLTAMRMKRGAIDFDLPESYVKLGPSHQVAAIERRPRNDAHRLVEEFMLAANEAVARQFGALGLPTVYRVHGQPKEEKLRAFAELARAFGHDIPVGEGGRIGVAAINDFLERVEGRPEQRALNHLLLRAMMQAVYSSENIGHFGLAAPSYLHFTSPIRRYPDLIVHRLLKSHWARGGKVPSERELTREAELLEELAVHCSERERAATAAEREIDSYYAASFMVQHVGKRFRGTVSSVAEFGLFVELDEPYVDGLIRAETLGTNPRLDERAHKLIFGRGEARSFGVGDVVEVEVTSADPVLRRIEFRLVENGKLVEHERPARFLADAIAELRQKRGSKGKSQPAGRAERGAGKPKKSGGSDGKQGGRPGGKRR